VNGVRINDAQSGHHNADVPVVLEDIDRIEVLYGPGSSLYGADAFGGTINIITRRPSGRRRHLTVSGGSYGFVDGAAALDWSRGGVAQSLAVSGGRSSGFMPARDFSTVTLASQTRFARGGLAVSHVRKDFGANGFYGPAPSRERTNGTFVHYDHRFPSSDGRVLTGAVSYRTHGDLFVYDPRVAGAAPNRHRTHAVEAALEMQHVLSDTFRVNAGATLGGDWIRSNNLSDHAFSRGSVFAEVQQRLGSRTLLYPGVRVDLYSNFGSAVSPSLSVSSWVLPQLKLRASGGRAFRIPTFTELYYRDPNHDATSTLRPEHAWESEAGFDWIVSPAWHAGVSAFARAEEDVIDWVRPSALVRWRTTNIRRVDARGLEAGVTRMLPDGSGFARVDYAYLDSDAGRVDFLSKYVLDYARHALTASVSVPLAARVGLGGRIAYKRRADGREYWVVDARLSRRLGSADIFIEGSNLLETRYQEIRGVDMPGRWIRAGLALSAF
jgi:iron complex outermembrane receptor protein